MYVSSTLTAEMEDNKTAYFERHPAHSTFVAVTSKYPNASLSQDFASRSPIMPLVLQQSLKENARQRVEVQLASYRDDPVLPSMMPGVSEEDKLAFFVEAGNKEFGLPWIKDHEIVDTDTGSDPSRDYFNRKQLLST